MSPLRAELRLLRWPLLGLGLAILIALAAGLAARHFVQQSEKQALAAELAAANSRNAVQQLQNDEQDIRIKIAAYQTLVARGIVGMERRLDWVELMRNIQRDRKLLGLEYEIQPRQAWTGGSSAGTGYRFMSSAVRIQIPLLHEEDLVRFLDDVHTGAAAFTRLRSCSLQRAPAAAMASKLAPQINAECQMDWITLMPENEAR
ncbi:MAG TPA: hypothetical protein VN066_03320 [Rhodocyclaceae bacterium]|nr:hypothetical protein [Rhodocyclaceae bacterium]